MQIRFLYFWEGIKRKKTPFVCTKFLLFFVSFHLEWENTFKRRYNNLIIYLPWIRIALWIATNCGLHTWRFCLWQNVKRNFFVLTFVWFHSLFRPLPNEGFVTFLLYKQQKKMGKKRNLILNATCFGLHNEQTLDFLLFLSLK